jgi:excinuclease ABC subunit A
MGPEGGEEGGYIVATGTPEELALQDTYTAWYVRKYLNERKVL